MGGRRAVVALTILVVGGLVATVAWSFIRADQGWVKVATVEELERSDIIYLEKQQVFVSLADSGDPTAVSAVTPHHRKLARFCPTSGLLESEHGRFDRFGIYLGGSEPRSLDRVASRVRDGVVEVDPSVVMEGPARGEVTPLQPEGQFCTPYDLGRPGFFADR